MGYSFRQGPHRAKNSEADGLPQSQTGRIRRNRLQLGMSEDPGKRKDDQVKNGGATGLCSLRRGNPLDCTLWYIPETGPASVWCGCFLRITPPDRSYAFLHLENDETYFQVQYRSVEFGMARPTIIQFVTEAGWGTRKVSDRKPSPPADNFL